MAISSGRRISLLPSQQQHGGKDKVRSPYSGVPGQDEKGHSNVLSFKVATYIKRQVNVLMAKCAEARGWETDSDFLRWCCRLGLETIAAEKRNGEELFRDTHHLNNAAARIVALQENYSNFERMIVKVESAVQQLTAQGQMAQVRQVIYDIYQEAYKLSDEDWRRFYVTEIEKRFKPHMKRLKISLKPSDQVSDELPNVYER